MVLGATGRVGRAVVRALLTSGRTVVAAVRSEDKAKEVRVCACVHVHAALLVTGTGHIVVLP